jgi:hypothetical protein
VAPLFQTECDHVIFGATTRMENANGDGSKLAAVAFFPKVQKLISGNLG